jgi:nucleoside-diphosphate-sugar epimerase
MRVFLTGGSGDLGQVLSRQLEERGDVPVCFDVRPPRSGRGPYVQGSILDREALQRGLVGADCVVHIAAWHGIHEATGAKDVYEFWDLNVTGTFYVFEAAVRAGVQRIVYISSTSVANWAGVYGHTKVLGEEVARAYAARHRLSVITLRPRAFIPPWNREVYRSFVEWAKWFWRGAVHIDDVSQAVVRAVDVLGRGPLAAPLVLTVDGASSTATTTCGTGTARARARPSANTIRSTTTWPCATACLLSGSRRNWTLLRHEGGLDTSRATV